jgi:cell division protein ZapD
LRLEDLFDKVAYFSAEEGAQEHHVALITLFEMLDVTGRADLKFDLVQELERQRQILLSFRNNPEISEEALSGALYEIEQASAALLAMVGKIGQNLRDNEWLMGIKNRSAIPGGVCEFDVPGYHYWLNRDVAFRQRDLAAWVAPMMPIRDGLGIVLRLLRASGRPETRLAERGTYQLMLAGRTAQLVRLRLSRDDAVIPEISANKYALNIRFTMPGTELRPKQSDVDVSFELTFCNL